MSDMTDVLEAQADVQDMKTGIGDSERKQLAGLLAGSLADTTLLMIKSQGYHWNVVGPLFKPIHELTEDHYTNLFEAADEIAERIRALGYPAPTSFTDLIARTALREEHDVTSAQDMVETLVRDHEAVVRQMRKTAEFAESVDDFATHDLLVERLTFHEKAIWMLRATIES
jgi:starvation-inducible DNA-binding protein